MIQQSHSWAYIWTKLKKDTCSPVFTAALFTIAKMWKQPKCPLTDEWVKKMWCIYTMEYHSAIKRNEILPFAATWMDLEIIILSEVSQTKTNIWYHFKWNLKYDTNELIYKTETDSWASSENLQTTNAGEGVEKREPSGTTGGNVNWYSHYGDQYGGSLKN